MIKLISAVLVNFVIIGILTWGEVFAFDDGDFQYWSTESVSKKISKHWKVTLEEELRWGDNGSNPYYNHSDLGFSYSGIASWLDISLNYRHIHEDKDGDWKEENRPHINATLKWDKFKLNLSNRARLEYRNREDAENYWRYRNKFNVELPFKFTFLEIQPYVADEIFYDFDIETLNRNRLYCGFSLKIVKNLKAKIYYLWETTEKSDKWNDTHILGTDLKLTF